MESITVNGKTVQITKNGCNIIGNNIVRNVTISRKNGKTTTVVDDQVVHDSFETDLDVKLEGFVANVTVYGNLTCGDVGKNVDCTGEIKCKNIQGNVTVTGDMECEVVNGNVNIVGNLTTKRS
jgi:hypothetical protein